MDATSGHPKRCRSAIAAMLRIRLSRAFSRTPPSERRVETGPGRRRARSSCRSPRGLPSPACGKPPSAVMPGPVPRHLAGHEDMTRPTRTRRFASKAPRFARSPRSPVTFSRLTAGRSNGKGYLRSWRAWRFRGAERTNGTLAAHREGNRNWRKPERHTIPVARTLRVSAALTAFSTTGTSGLHENGLRRGCWFPRHRARCRVRSGFPLPFGVCATLASQWNSPRPPP